MKKKSPPKPPTKRGAIPPEDLPDMTPSEDERKMAVITQALTRGYSLELIVSIARAQFGIGYHATKTLVERSRQQLGAEAEERKPHTRGEQIARLRTLISELRKPRLKAQSVVKMEGGKRVKVMEMVEQPPRAQDIMRTEEQLARLEGNEAPIKIEIEHVLSTAAQQVFAALTPEKYGALLARSQERKRLAAAAVSAGIVTIDAPVTASDVVEGKAAE